MRQIVIAAVALVVGVVLGGLGPRAELHVAQARADEKADCRPQGVGHDLATMLGGGLDRRDADGKLKRPTDVPEDDTDAGRPVDGRPPADAPPRDGEGFHVAVGDGGDDTDGGPQTIEAAKEALELRRTQARAALMEDADPSDEQVAKIDDAVDKMNTQLADLADELAANVQDHGQPTRREAMEFASQALDIVITADDDIHGTLTQDQLDQLDDEATDPFSYVDPKILDTLAALDQGRQR